MFFFSSGLEDRVCINIGVIGDPQKYHFFGVIDNWWFINIFASSITGVRKIGDRSPKKLSGWLGSHPMHRLGLVGCGMFARAAWVWAPARAIAFCELCWFRLYWESEKEANRLHRFATVNIGLEIAVSSDRKSPWQGFGMLTDCVFHGRLQQIVPNMHGVLLPDFARYRNHCNIHDLVIAAIPMVTINDFTINDFTMNQQLINHH